MQYLKGPEPYLSRPLFGTTASAKSFIPSLARVALYRNVELPQSQILAEEKIIRDRMEELKFSTPQNANGEVYWKEGGPAEQPVFHPSTNKPVSP